MRIMSTEAELRYKVQNIKKMHDCVLLTWFPKMHRVRFLLSEYNLYNRHLSLLKCYTVLTGKDLPTLRRGTGSLYISSYYSYSYYYYYYYYY